MDAAYRPLWIFIKSGRSRWRLAWAHQVTPAWLGQFGQLCSRRSSKLHRIATASSNRCARYLWQFDGRRASCFASLSFAAFNKRLSDCRGTARRSISVEILSAAAQMYANSIWKQTLLCQFPEKMRDKKPEISQNMAHNRNKLSMWKSTQFS